MKSSLGSPPAFDMSAWPKLWRAFHRDTRLRPSGPPLARGIFPQGCASIGRSLQRMFRPPSWSCLARLTIDCRGDRSPHSGTDRHLKINGQCQFPNLRERSSLSSELLRVGRKWNRLSPRRFGVLILDSRGGPSPYNWQSDPQERDNLYPSPGYDAVRGELAAEQKSNQ